ncbi:MAG: hypothetical protein ACJATV_001690 [Granulosicoccus sp.]|jgi:hypothetical protein
MNTEKQNTGKIIVIDNFLEDIVFDELQKLMVGPDLPWHLGEKLDWTNQPPTLGEWEEKKDNVAKYNYQLFHIFHKHVEGETTQSDFFEKLQPFVKKIGIFSLYRLRATFNHRTENPLLLGGYHTDLEEKYKKLNVYTGIFYCNSNNGYTSFLNGAKVSNVANRFVSFPCDLMHSAVSCTDEQYRIQLNVNYVRDIY